MLARARPDRGADRRAPLPGGQARPPRRRGSRPRRRPQHRGALTLRERTRARAVPARLLDPEGPGEAVLPLRGGEGRDDGRDHGGRDHLHGDPVRAELGPKADPPPPPPRPEWYFFFLFELLRVVKPPELVFLATIGIPTICLVLLLMLPFFDRGRSATRCGARSPPPARRHDRRDGLPHGARALAGSPTEIELATSPQYEGQGDHGPPAAWCQDRRERQHAGAEPHRDRPAARARRLRGRS